MASSFEAQETWQNVMNDGAGIVYSIEDSLEPSDLVDMLMQISEVKEICYAIDDESVWVWHLTEEEFLELLTEATRQSRKRL